MNEHIVIVDDEEKLLKALIRALEIENFKVLGFVKSELAFDYITKNKVDLVISDIRMPKITGLELLQKIKAIGNNIPFILMTAFSSVETAVTAVKLGADDYLLKPFEVSELKNSVSQVLKKYQQTNTQSIIDNDNKIIGQSSSIKKIQSVIQQISDTDTAVLISGESGTGKELIARFIHKNSKRRNKPFVIADCSAMSEAVFEKEMFGIENETATSSNKKGFFKEAEGGTIFFDEIGDLSLHSQAKLLRVLQDGIYRTLSINTPIKSDVRVIAATSKALSKEATEGNFREDLLYRVNIVEIQLPPLRQRREDIKELANFFIAKSSKQYNRQIIDIDEDFYRALSSYNWPGNVRQLENTIERAIILKKDGYLSADDLALSHTSNEADDGLSPLPNENEPLSDTIERIEESIILQALEMNNWNYSKTASLLGITRQNLHYKLKKYKLQKKANEQE